MYMANFSILCSFQGKNGQINRSVPPLGLVPHGESWIHNSSGKSPAKISVSGQ